MACGTPVVAFRNGSVDEVMKDGVSGFIVDSLEQAIDAASRIAEIDRRKCRLHFQERFTVEAMALGYTEVYEKLIRRVSPSPSAHSMGEGDSPQVFHSSNLVQYVNSPGFLPLDTGDKNPGEPDYASKPVIK